MCLLKRSYYFPPAKDGFVHRGEPDCLMSGFMPMTRANEQALGLAQKL